MPCSNEILYWYCVSLLVCAFLYLCILVCKGKLDFEPSKAITTSLDDSDDSQPWWQRWRCPLLNLRLIEKWQETKNRTKQLNVRLSERERARAQEVKFIILCENKCSSLE